MENFKNLIKKDRLGFAVVFPNYSALSVDEIRQIFSKFGRVRSIHETGDERGYRFVRMDTYEEAKNAIEGLHKKSKIKFCTHGRRKKAPNTKLDYNNNSGDTQNFNRSRYDEDNTSTVSSDDSDNWDEASQYSSHGMRKRSGSSVSVRYNKSASDSHSSGNRSGNIRETSTTRRNTKEKPSGTRSAYSRDRDRTTADRSTRELDTDWRSTRDKPSSGNVDECQSVANAEISIWDFVRSSNSQSSESSSTVTNSDSNVDWDFSKSSDSQNTMRSRTAKNEDCDSGIWSNNHTTESSKTESNEDCSSIWDSIRSSFNRNSVDGKTQKNENKKSNPHNAMCLKNSRNIDDESVSKSWESFWNKHDQNKKSNHNIKEKSSLNKSTENTKRVVLKQKVDCQSRMDNVRNMNNHHNAKASKDSSDDDVEDERVPDLVQKKTQAYRIRQEIVERNASEVIVGNIPENATSAYILYLFEEFAPIAISRIFSAPSDLRYCYVYFQKDKNALDIEQKYDGYKLSGKRLIVSRPNRLTVLAYKDCD